MGHKTIICTLFEKDYHHGVSVLVNSIYASNFRGDIFIGYKGNLPDWVKEKAIDTSVYSWAGGILVYEISSEFRLFFLKINTKKHLAHYKPLFMLELMNNVSTSAEKIVYFDPDIILKCNWLFFEVWMDFGVALVHEITMHDMPSSHPTRRLWEKIIIEAGYKITRQLSSYINSGFCGVTRNNLEFLSLWNSYVDIAINEYGQDETLFATFDRTALFWNIDQDTFNMTAMSSNTSISEYGPEGMDFLNGGQIMSHATGTPKPWNKKFILNALKGNPPSLADKFYWKNSNNPIKLYNTRFLDLKKKSILIASFMGRFYKKL